MEIRQGGEDVPLGRRPVLAVVEHEVLLGRLRSLTTRGIFTDEICRCPGDLTLVLLDCDDFRIGVATLHPESLAWEREIFRNDLVLGDQLALRLLLANVGVNGAASGVLHSLISKLDLHEGEVQFRQAGDDEALAVRHVPPSLVQGLRPYSGEEAAQLDQGMVRGFKDRLLRAEGESRRAVRQLMAWLGSATWPAEAVAGDGQLARRILGEFDPGLVMQAVREISEPREIMGAVAWAAFQSEDAAIMDAIGPQVTRMLAFHGPMGR
ncbi:hypothetical protein ACIA5A_26620 [Micromonospora sp. NPDC051300]|uniref:hypothetical protein n=1 Tax=Micromonospora sp. NPDC051300 TaxID=3364286 RepID=UPI00378DDDC2